MVIYDTQIVAALKIILPCYYENYIKDSIELPCITYMSNANESEAEGDTQRVSHLGYTIKLWVDNIEHKSYLTAIQSKMKEMGFVLSGTTEIVNGRVIQVAMNFEATGLEIY